MCGANGVGGGMETQRRRRDCLAQQHARLQLEHECFGEARDRVVQHNRSPCLDDECTPRAWSGRTDGEEKSTLVLSGIALRAREELSAANTSR